ncbi:MULTISPECIES: hypothetical protein [unclassified Microbacterium]|uniref:hypothetical protein n=1 Tax=unclassified Microbacterium TaxID=2609290 RepID=UPI00386571B2
MSDDFSELYALASDLSDAPDGAARNMRKAVEVTARFIKDDWQQGAERTGLEGYASSIDYDVEVSSNSIDAEIGPNLGKSQGPLGLVEEANGDVRSSPQNAGRDALRANESDFERGLQIAILDATEKAVRG